MAGQGYSGVNGTVLVGVNPIAEIRTWKFNPKSNNPKYASNFTSGYKRTVAGVKEGTGSMHGAHVTSNPFLAVADAGMAPTLLLYTDATHFFSVPSVIDDVSVDVDVDSGEIVSWDANFSTNGAWTNPASPQTLPPQYAAKRTTKGKTGDEVPEQKTTTMTPEMMALIAKTAADAAVAAVLAGMGQLPTP